MKNIFELDTTICKFNFALFLRSLMLLSPILLLFYNENGLNTNDLFFCQGIFYIFAILFDIPVGYFSNTKPRKYLLLLAFILFFSISFLWLFFKGYYVIIAGEILYALTKTILDSVPSAYIYDYLSTKNKQMSKYWGYSNFFMSSGIATGSLIGAFLYKYFGSSFILITECILMIICIFIIATLPNIKSPNDKHLSFTESIKEYVHITKNICKKDNIIYYILYSGFFNALSYLFILSFQPIMKNSMFPIVLFGVISFINYFIKSCAGIIVVKWLRNVCVNRLIIPLYILYIITFCCIFIIFMQNNVPLNFILMTVICIIIGVQIIFLILHISRLQRLVPFEHKGSLMTINNCVARFFAAIFLFSSKLFLNNAKIYVFFIIVFLFYIIFGSYITMKTSKITD